MQIQAIACYQMVFLSVFLTGAGGIADEVEERVVDVEDDELEVRVPLPHGVRGHLQLRVEDQGVVVQALYAAAAGPATEEGKGRREAAHRRQRRHADPPRPQPVQALHVCMPIIGASVTTHQLLQFSPFKEQSRCFVNPTGRTQLNNISVLKPC